MFRKITLFVLFTLLLTPAAFADPDLPGAAANLESIPVGSLIIPMDTVHQNATDGGVENFNLAAYGLANKMLQNNIPLKWAIRSDKVKISGIATAGSNATTLNDTTKDFVLLGVKVGDLVTNVDTDPMARKRVTAVATNTLTLANIDATAFATGHDYVIDGYDFTATAARIRPGADIPAASVTFTSGPFIVSSENPAALAKALEIIDGVSDLVPPVLPLFDDTAAQSAVRVYQTTTVTNNVDVRYNLTHKPFILVSNINTYIHADILTEAGIPGAAGALGADDEDYTNCAPTPGDPNFDPNVCNWNQINPLDLSLFECATLHVEPHRDEPGDDATIGLINVAVQNFLSGGGNSAWQCRSVRYLENLDDDPATPPGKFMTSLGIDPVNASNPQSYPNSPVPFSQFSGPLNGAQGGSVQGWDLNGGTYDKNEAYVVTHNAANNLIHKAAAAKVPTGGDIGGNIFYLGGHEFTGNTLEAINGRRMILNTLFVPADRDPLCGLTIEASLIIVKEVINDDGGTADVDDFGITTDAGDLVWGAGVPVGDTTTYTADTLTVLAGQPFSLSESDLPLYSEGLWSCEGGDDLGGGAFNSGTVTLGPGDTKTCTITNNDIAQNPDITIDKEGSLDLGVDGIANPGDLITYQFSVSNVGDVVLTSVAVTDPLVGLSAIDCTPEANPIASIAVGAPPVLCTATYPITQADIDAGLRNNTATATAQCGVPACPVDDEDPNSETIPASPAVTIDKEGTFDPGADAVSTIGDIISYTFDVENTGNITLTNVAVTDPLVGLSVIDCTPEANPIASLAPGVTVQCTATYAITQDDLVAGSRDNTASVSGDCSSQVECPVTDDDPNTEVIPTDSNIDLIKTLENPAVLQPDGSYTVIYIIQAVNSGNALGTYDLVDTFSLGSGIALNSATAVYVPGSEITQTGTLGVYPNFVTGETLAAGLDESWEVTANFEVQADEVDSADSQCDPADPVIDTGFYNAVTGVVDEEDTTNNDTCTNLPPPDINLAKTLGDPATATLELDGTYTVVYTITATNNGQGPGYYDLVDTFSPAAGITLNEATAVYVGGTELSQTGLTGVYPNFVTGEALAGSLDETWTVTANFTVDPAVVADEDRACDPADPVINTGFYNAVSGVDQETDTTDNATCTELPEADINLAKTMGDPATATLELDGTYTVVYTITATNNGDGPGVYDLVDTFSPAAGITVNPTPTALYVAGTEDDQSGTTGAYPNFVTGETLAGGLNESWTVTANFTVDPAVVADEDRACDPADPVINTGFYNAVSGVDEETDTTDNATCTELPEADINLAKTLVGPATLELDGTYTVVYTITATNNGDGPGFYDLVDTFSPAAGITVNPTPTALYVAGTEDDQSGTTAAYPNFVTGEALTGGLNESWTVTANFTVDPAVVADEDRACDPADPVINTGFYNAVSGVDEETDTTDNATCTELPETDINLAKTVTTGPTLEDGSGSFAAGTYTVVYTITATNNGDGPGVYDLVDTFSPAVGITLNPTPTALYVAGTEDDQSGTTAAYPNFVTGETLAGGLNESWTVTANFTVDPASLDPEDSFCDPATPAANTGFYNAVSGVDEETDTTDNDACVPFQTVTLVAVESCVNDVPWVNYSVTTFGFNPAPTEVTLTWINQDEEPDVIVSGPTVYTSFTDDILWPGATADGADPGANGLTWPGWTESPAGVWTFDASTLLQPNLVLVAEVNPTDSVALVYPPAQPVCNAAPPAVVTLTKTVTGVTDNQDGTFDVAYRVEVSNTGGQSETYSLLDILAVDASLTPAAIVAPLAYSAGTENDQTGTLGTPAIGDFTTGADLVTDETLAAGLNEAFTFTLQFELNPDAYTAEGANCTLTSSETGTGFTNNVELYVDEVLVAEAQACQPIPPPPQESARATFTVQKEFMDGNDITDASFRIDCNTGLILDQDKTTHIRPGELYSVENFEVEFVVTDFTQGAMTCTVWEDPAPTGYTPSYDCDSNTLATCDTGDESDLDDYFVGPCVFNLVDTTEIGPDPWQHLCVIRNYPNPVPVVINKDWVIEGSGGDYIDPYYQLKLSCDNEIITEGAYYSYGKWRIVFNNISGTNNADYTAMVIPDWDGGTSCEVSESFQDQAVEIDNGCTNVLAQLGSGDECTITNTVFFEGIPTLNQYGIALLALLMLGMGLVGFRRFS